jgi:hypothetical protein
MNPPSMAQPNAPSINRYQRNPSTQNDAGADPDPERLPDWLSDPFKDEARNGQYSPSDRLETIPSNTPTERVNRYNVQPVSTPIRSGSHRSFDPQAFIERQQLEENARSARLRRFEQLQSQNGRRAGLSMVARDVEVLTIQPQPLTRSQRSAQQLIHSRQLETVKPASILFGAASTEAHPSELSSGPVRRSFRSTDREQFVSQASSETRNEPNGGDVRRRFSDQSNPQGVSTSAKTPRRGFAPVHIAPVPK